MSFTTNSNIINQVAYLKTTREFPDDLYQLSRESNRAWIESANAVNNRIIGIFPTGKPAQTGESWFINSSSREQTLRQTYTFGAVTNGTTMNTGFKFNSTPGFTRCWGQYTDSSGNWYGLIFGSSTAIAAQISFWLQVNGSSNNSDQIVFQVGAAAPTPVSGTLVLEWLSAV